MVDNIDSNSSSSIADQLLAFGSGVIGLEAQQKQVSSVSQGSTNPPTSTVGKLTANPLMLIGGVAALVLAVWVGKKVLS